MLSTILIVVLILLLVGALPTWPYSSGWGYYPGGGLGLVPDHRAHSGAIGQNLSDRLICSAVIARSGDGPARSRAAR